MLLDVNDSAEHPQNWLYIYYQLDALIIIYS